MDDWHSASEAADPPLPAYEENGRLYHGSYKGMYLMPCDEIESNRLDFLHFIIRGARRLARIPIPPNNLDPKNIDWRELHAVHFGGLFWASGQRPPILDLGCGTGIWAVEMAKKYPKAEIVGVDIVNIYPNRKTCENFPQNCYLQKGAINFETPWGMDADHWSFIRLGSLCGSVSNWEQLYRRIYHHLKPGHGTLEQVEIDLTPRCDDNSLPDDAQHPINKWYELLVAATSGAGRSVHYDPQTPQLLEAIGFVDVRDYVVRLPLHPQEDWPSTKDARYLGRIYYSYLIGNRKACGSRDSAFEALSLAAFTRELGWTYEKWEEFQEYLIDAVSRPGMHVYHELFDNCGEKHYGRPEDSKLLLALKEIGGYGEI